MVHASKAAAPWSAAINPYQIALFRSVSKDSGEAGLTALFNNGALPGTAVSTPDPAAISSSETFETFSVGASGLVDFASSAGVAGAADFTSTAGGVVAVRGASVRSDVQHKVTSAVMIKDHLSYRKQGMTACPCDSVHSTVPEDRCHWSFGHVLLSTSLPLLARALPRPSVLLLSASPAFPQNCYNPDR